MYWIIAALGLLLIAAPFGLQYTGEFTALWTSIVLGVLVALVALYKAIVKDTGRWEYGAAGVLGILAIIAPFVFQFQGITLALWALVILGALLVLLDGYQLFVRQRMQ
jgi:hypothetical protein